MNDMRISSPADPQALAQAAGEVLFSRDQAAQTLGMQLVTVAPGRACITMTVRPDMLNAHGSCHGGVIFTLADTAFALACNSYNQNTVASGCTIDYLAPGCLDEVLTAAAVEQSLAGRTGVYDIMVTNQAGKRIALFRGRSYRIKGEVLDTMVPPPMPEE
jgi:acyl-CoA thioesterase